MNKLKIMTEEYTQLITMWLEEQEDEFISELTGIQLELVKNRIRDIEYMLDIRNTIRNVPRDFYNIVLQSEIGKDITNLPTWLYADKYIQDNNLDIIT